MGGPDIRWIQRFDNFKRAFARLSEASELAKQRDLSDLERQGLIQAFEFTHELAWNTLKDFLTARGWSETLYGSRDATRAAFAAELIEDGGAWMEMIKHRNESSHTYNEEVAGRIMEAVQTRYVPAFEAFQRRFLGLGEGGVRMNHGLSETTVEEIRGVLAHFPEVEQAVLYGSRAKGTHRPGSDIDLTLHGRSLDHTLLARIDEELDDLLLPYQMDLSLFASLTHPALLDHIRRVGEVLYERTPAGQGVRRP